MNRIKKLAQVYARHISLPWREDAAQAQRIIFCIYNAAEERILRANLAEFEIATTNAGHSWQMFDLGGTFAKWLSAQKYAEKYFQNPARLNAMAMERYLGWLMENYDAAMSGNCDKTRVVVALTGIAELFGFFKVRSLLDKLEPKIAGRLVVFFGSSTFRVELPAQQRLDGSANQVDHGDESRRIPIAPRS